jgi:tetratricopeptide (TPR) repeat protein
LLDGRSLKSTDQKRQNERMKAPALASTADSVSVSLWCDLRPNRLGAAFMLVAMLAVCGHAQQDRLTTIPDSNPSPGWLREAPLDPSQRTAVLEAVKNRRYARAEALVLEQHNKNPDSSALLVALGNILFLDGQYLNCAVAMKKADALSPLGERDRFTLAMAYVTLKHGDWARPEIQKLAQDNPANALYPYWLSRLAYHDMHLADAVAEVNKAIQLDPRFMKAYDNLGLYDEGLGKQEEAIDAYQHAVRLNQENGLHSPWPACNLGALLNKLGRLDEAKTYLTESLKEAPGFPQAHFQLGLLFEKRSRDTDAMRELHQAMASDPSYAEPYFVLGKILQKEHRTKEAEEALNTFERLKNSEQTRESSE